LDGWYKRSGDVLWFWWKGLAWMLVEEVEEGVVVVLYERVALNDRR
jgi:hypothetical protein